MSIVIGWPQGIWIALSILSLIATARLNPENLPFIVPLEVISYGLLYWGGFFT